MPSSPRILIVDDDVALRRGLARAVSRAGMEPAEAGTVREAIDVLGRLGADVMILDIGLPTTSGHALLAEFNRRRVGLPVIVVSGRGEVEDVIKVLRNHAFDFLPKPLSVPVVLDAVRRALASPEHRPFRPGAMGGADGETTQPPAPAAPATPTALESSLGAPPEDTEREAPSGDVPEETGGPGRLARWVEESQGLTAEATLPEIIDALFRGVVRGDVHLPAIEPRVEELRVLMQQPDAGGDRVAELIAQDPAMTASVLRAANAPILLPGERIGDLREACVRLGNRQVFAIAQEILITGSLRARVPPYRELMRRAGRASILAARLAVRLGSLLGHPDPLSLHVLALLHNVGELLLLELLSELPATSLVHTVTPEELAAEVARSHERFGRALAEAWHLPPAVVRVVGAHHRPARVPEPVSERRLRALVLSAWGLAVCSGHGYLPGQEEVDARRWLESLGVGDDDIGALIEEATAWSE
ncbi:MAG: HDOD domain-containing protein [Deltaproteobacteria bacterium]|nr:HDOD domain-containing protein [Deltaproteobacteria bacterium]